MSEFNSSTFLIAYIISNLVGLLILWASVSKPKWARWIFVLLFSWAAVVNFTTAQLEPNLYMSYGPHALPLYRDFIFGWFQFHISVFVSLVAIGQLLIVFGLLLPGIWFKLACIGIIIFLLAIAPLGWSTAFPFSIVVSLAAFFLMRTADIHTTHIPFRKHKTVY